MSVRFEVIVAGDPGAVLLAALSDFELQPSPAGQTRLVGTLVDEAALHGALHRLQDLRVDLLEVRRLDNA